MQCVVVSCYLVWEFLLEGYRFLSHIQQLQFNFLENSLCHYINQISQWGYDKIHFCFVFHTLKVAVLKMKSSYDLMTFGMELINQFCSTF